MGERAVTRIDDARSRVTVAKRRISVVATAGFVAVVGLAYASHPGTASPSPVTVGGDNHSFGESDDSLDFGYYGSIAPSFGSVPQVRTSVS